MLSGQNRQHPASQQSAVVIDTPATGKSEPDSDSEQDVPTDHETQESEVTCKSKPPQPSIKQEPVVATEKKIVPPKSISCAVCTFINKNGSTRCEMCASLLT